MNTVEEGFQGFLRSELGGGGGFHIDELNALRAAYTAGRKSKKEYLTKIEIQADGDNFDTQAFVEQLNKSLTNSFFLKAPARKPQEKSEQVLVAEKMLRDYLQKLHNKTGFIPEHIRVESVETTVLKNDIKSVQITEVDLSGKQ